MSKLKTLAVIPVFIGALLCQPVFAGDMDTDSVLLHSVGEFEVGNGDNHTIANHKTDTRYRICVRHARHSTALKVTHDGLETIINPGSCSDVQGKRIKVSPAGKLGDDMVLIGKYHHLEF